ncbi:MAG: surface lipoprotein assembly modifier [candidate division KSB1 bacterium]|nr:surface lipoprotein assembly modifier [candidate division KSB1 bacterium]MDZ7302638.1 surface lipoprotein assembly modifier [candidate division KSB1 bacterium]MDZ7311523.1 surface lipoprotein assembly modifier [candidate division KSB1 bacterium]
MRRLLMLTLLFSLVALGPGDPALAQFRLGAQLMTMYDDNVNNNYLSITDRVALLSLRMARDWEGERHNTQIFYIGSWNYFNTVNERAFHYHALGLTYSHLLGPEPHTTFNTGLTYNFRVNRASYTFYDHQQISAYANLRHHLAERTLGRLSYTLRYLDFSELADFNYVEHYAFAQLTQSFTTKTTLILETDLGMKIYTTANVEESGAGRGYGRRITTSTPRVTQWAGIARLGQGLREGTGLSLTAQYQRNLQKESRYLSSDYGLISDDELFDDHYGYEGWQTSLMLTQLLPAGMVMKLAASVQDRHYSERAAYDLSGNPIADTRVDTRKAFSVHVDKSFRSLGIVLGLTYDYIRNASNDFYYDYNNRAITMQLSIGH